MYGCCDLSSERQAIGAPNRQSVAPSHHSNCRGSPQIMRWIAYATWLLAWFVLLWSFVFVPISKSVSAAIQGFFGGALKGFVLLAGLAILFYGFKFLKRTFDSQSTHEHAKTTVAVQASGDTLKTDPQSAQPDVSGSIENALANLDPTTFELLARLYPWAHAYEDLPEEVANTFANILYRLNLDFNQSGPFGLRNDEEVNAESWLKAAQIRNRTIAEAAVLPEFHEVLKAAPRRTDEERALYDFLVQDFLDTYKYRIEDCSNKTPTTRAAERTLKQPDEIPGLYGLLRHANEILKNAPISSNENADTLLKAVIDCPSCQQRLRVPFGRRLQVTCARCGTVFPADLRV